MKRSVLIDNLKRAADAQVLYRRPKVAAIDYRNSAGSFDAATLAAQSKYEYVLRNMSSTQASGASGTDIGRQFMQALKAANPAIKVGQYTILSQQAVAGADYTAIYNALNSGGSDAASWWVKAAGTATKTRADLAYAAYEVNQTDYPARDGKGNRAIHAIAQGYVDNWLKKLGDAGALDFVFNDNVFVGPHKDLDVPLNPLCGDYNLDGVNDDPTDATLKSEYRKGYVRYWAALKARLFPGLRIAANTEPDSTTFMASVSTAELSGKADIGLLEAVVGRSYSIDTYNYFSNVMTWYRSVIDNVRETAFLLIYIDSNNTIDALRKSRYGLGITMLDNGHCMLADEPGKLSGSGQTMRQFWVDEFDQMIGKPTEARQTAARNTGVWAGKGLWARDHENGLVVVNPSDNRGKWMANVGTVTLSRSAGGVVRLDWTNWSAGNHGAAVGDKVWIDETTGDGGSFNGFFTINNTGATWIEWSQAGNTITLNKPVGFFRLQTSVDLSALGLRRFLGSQDAHNNYDQGTSQNDGTAVTTLKLWAGDAILLLKA